MALIRTIGGGGGTARLFALGALLALLAAAALSLAPAAGQEDPSEFELILSLDEDSDNIVPAGSEVTVNAELRFPWRLPFAPPDTLSGYTAYQLPLQIPTLSSLRIAGGLEWDSAGRQRLDIAAHTPLVRRLPPAPTGALRRSVKAFDGRTLVARSDTRQLYIYDSYTLQHAATIEPPAGTFAGQHSGSKGFGASSAFNPDGTDYRGGWHGKAIDVWHETADRAWLFVGSWADRVGTNDLMGRLHRFRLDWDDNGVTVTHLGWLTPPLAEADNRWGAAVAQYGGAVSFSRDGGTLAVGAPRMNVMGAVYVYSRPDGPGQDWGDITYADGVKVTVGAVPSLGTGATNMPFLPGTAYDASNPRSCDAWCSMVWSSMATQSYDGVDLGVRRMSLSADGSVLLVGAPNKEYAVTTPGGGFTNANRRQGAGEAYVWLAPEGGWQNAPRADLDAGGNAKTLIAAKTDATNFRRATHYSPGPLRRVTEPAAILAAGTWPNVGSDWFGLETAISLDGSTALVARWTSTAYIFQRDSAGDWASVNGGYLAPSATLSQLSQPSQTPPHFSVDGSELLIGQPRHNPVNTGSVRVFSRPADGTWVSAAGWSGRLLQEPADVRSSSSRFGYMTPELTGSRMAFGTQEQHREYLASADGCSISTVDGASFVRCPLTLPSSTITIPDGMPDGPFTISGSVAVQLGSGEPLTLRDSIEVTIGTVKEVDSADLAIAVNPGDPNIAGDAAEGPYPSLLRNRGDSTRLLLRILSENGKASHAGSVAAVLISSSAGNLGVVDATLEGEACSGISCQLDNTKINANNADRLLITLSHDGKPATADVRATVFSASGESFETESVSIALAGPADRIAVAAPTSGVLNMNTSAEDDDGVDSDDADNRDRLLLAVTALDAAGNNVALPAGARRSNLIGPDGASVAAGSVRVIFPHRADPDERVTDAEGNNAPILTPAGAQQVRIDVDRPAANPLPSGEYTLELWAGAKMAEQTFTVSGGPVAGGISLSDPGAVALGQSFTVTAMFNDASGVPVPNGTLVDWPEILSTGGAGQLVVQTSKDTRTQDGRASASFLAVNPGSVVVTAGAGCEERPTSAGGSVTVCSVSGVRLVNIQPDPTGPADHLSNREPGGLSSWLGRGVVTAAELLSALDDVDSILIWLNGEWIRYGLADGRPIPGSINFNITPGAILWLGGDD